MSIIIMSLQEGKHTVFGPDGHTYRVRIKRKTQQYAVHIESFDPNNRWTIKKQVKVIRQITGKKKKAARAILMNGMIVSEGLTKKTARRTQETLKSAKIKAKVTCNGRRINFPKSYR